MHAKLLQLFPTLCTLWTVAANLLCPWDSPGKNTRVGCHFLLQKIFPTRIKPEPHLLCLLHWQADSSPLHHPGKPFLLIRGHTKTMEKIKYL